MTEVKSGDTVRIHYVGTFPDGTKFDSSEGRDPLVFEVGSGQIIPGLDKSLPGMSVGDRKTVNVPATEGYGPVDPNARHSVPRDQIPANIPLESGAQLQMQSPQGQVINVTVTDLTEENCRSRCQPPARGKRPCLRYRVGFNRVGIACAWPSEQAIELSPIRRSRSPLRRA